MLQRRRLHHPAGHFREWRLVLTHARDQSATFPVCEFSIEGKADGPTLVFIHGWPDNASLWRKQVEALGVNFRCVLVTLPNFGAQPVKAGGCDFPELLGSLAATIRQVQPHGKVSLVTHDWGSYAGYMLEKAHPEWFEKMAALDIGGHLAPVGARAVAMIMGYQWALIACWLIGGLVPPLGAWMTRGVGRVIKVPARQLGNIRSRYNYPYFYFWRNLLLPWRRANLLNRYRPRCPVLFLFGERKPVMFHSPRWLEIVAGSGGRSEGIAGAGHWLMETHAGTVNEKLGAWFQHDENLTFRKPGE
ncbi:alpha/beta fold hydrolase [Pseudomonadota bacterium]